MKNTNDPYESLTWETSPGAWGDSDDFIRQVTKIAWLTDLTHSRCHLFCTTKDGLRPEYNPQEYSVDRGFALPQLWAHYARGNSGVCLAFDSQKLEQAITNAAPNDSKIYNGSVNYTGPPKENDPAFDIDLTNVDDIELQDKLLDHIENYHKTLFFLKDSNWSYEREVRFVVVAPDDDDIEVDISSSLVGLITGSNFSDAYSPLINEARKQYGIETALIEWGQGRPFLIPAHLQN